MKRLKWNGWGYEGEEFPQDRTRKIVEVLRSFLGISEEDFSPSLNLEQINLPEPKIDYQLLQKKLKSSSVSVERYDRVLNSSGKSYKNLVRLRKGTIKNFPDAVVYVKDKNDIFEVLSFCEDEKIACIPRGGGTSVVGGVDTEEISSPVLVCDLTYLNKVVDVDTKSLSARVQAGVRGPNLEEQLRNYGLALRHYPQSFYFSTLGGWIAARSAGHFSSRYGKIEDMIQSIEVITPRGVVKNFDVPSTACGPDIPRTFAGSEGILGIITEAVVKCHKIPTKKFSTAFVFPDFETACEVARKIIQSEIYPPLLRILDEREHMISSLLSGRPYDGGALLLLGFESDDQTEDIVRAEFEKTSQICIKSGGKDEGKVRFEDWKKEYFEQPYLRDVLLDFCIVVDTLETATSWSNLMNLYRRVKEAMEQAIFSETLGGVTCRVTHVYTTGASLYYSFFAKAQKGKEEELWWKIKKAASDAISNYGGTISHHHGVGRDHKIWAQKELKDSLVFLKGLKISLDPKNIMNPGAVLDI
jgi:alkyldihydroxyacetonephosphate synthase